MLMFLGDAHRKQRKMLNPAFSTDHMRLMTPMFYEIARKVFEFSERAVRAYVSVAQGRGAH